MSKIFNQFLILALSLLFVACVPPSEQEPVEEYILISPSTELTLYSNASSATLTIESSGEWEVSDVEEWCSVTPTRGSSGQDIVVTVEENPGAEERTLEFSISSGSAVATVKVVQMAHFNTNYVDLGLERGGTTTEFDTVSGVVTVTYSNGDIPNVEVGNAIVLPSDYMFDIRVVDSVSSLGKTLTMETSAGNMCNLFYDTSFTLATSADTRAFGLGARPVITPCAVGYLDEQNNYIEFYNDDSQTSRARYTIETKFWEFDANYGNAVIYDGTAGRLWWDKCQFDAELSGIFDFEFTLMEGGNILNVGELEKFSYKLRGEFGADLLLKYKYQYADFYTEDEIIKKNVLPRKVFKFRVGAVIVPIILHTHLGQYFEVGSWGIVEAEGGADVDIEIEAGLEWTKQDGAKPIAKGICKIKPYTPMVTAEASASVKISFYPQIEIGLYSFIGPWLEPRSYIKEVVNVGYYMSPSQESFMPWTDNYYSGLDMRMGLDLKFGVLGDVKVFESDIFNVVDDTTLFTTPKRITLLSPKNENLHVVANEGVDVEIKVESYNALMDKYVACANVPVEFVAETGKISYGVTLSDVDGIARVRWTPSVTRANTRDSKLIARIYNSCYEVIDEKVVNLKVDTPENGMHNGHEWVDLGLSVKWASCNVGAVTPEQFGGYFAWGETMTKSEYHSGNYSYDYSFNAGSRSIHQKNTTDKIRIEELGDDISGTIYDAATVNWGGSWRMPTEDEVIELNINCKKEWVVQNDTFGVRVTGPSGNSIFIPAAGYISGSTHQNAEDCYYWISTASQPIWAWSFDDLSFTVTIPPPYDRGQPIRPVY